MLSAQTKGWVGTGALKYSLAMADSKRATDKHHRARDSKTTPPTQVPEVCEKTVDNAT